MPDVFDGLQDAERAGVEVDVPGDAGLFDRGCDEGERLNFFTMSALHIVAGGLKDPVYRCIIKGIGGR